MNDKQGDQFPNQGLLRDVENSQVDPPVPSILEQRGDNEDDQSTIRLPPGATIPNDDCLMTITFDSTTLRQAVELMANVSSRLVRSPGKRNREQGVAILHLALVMEEKAIVVARRPSAKEPGQD
jgi:hypothetical protein